MKKNTKKIIIGLASILLLASLIFIVIFFSQKDARMLKKELSNMAIDYYENDYKKFFPDTLKKWKEYRVDLDGLKGSERDITIFEEHKCDLEETYATLIYKDDDNYSVKVHLACEE